MKIQRRLIKTSQRKINSLTKKIKAIQTTPGVVTRSMIEKASLIMNRFDEQVDLEYLKEGRWKYRYDRKNSSNK